ncbi:MAG: xanthine dehydrogenase family protein molybdopterin-binding subunit [Bacillota bacterium]
MRHIGKPQPIFDAKEKVTGEMIYADDLFFSNMLYGKILTSPVAHAKIKLIDTIQAEQLLGVRAVVTYKDAPDVLYNRNMQWINDDKPATERVLDKVVRYVGDRVAAVAADTEEIARKAVSLINVEYEELPAIFDPEEALKENAYPLYPEGNLVREQIKACGDVDQALNDSYHVTQNTVSTAMVHHGAIEPHICIAHSSREGEISIWEPQRAPFRTQIMLGKIFNIPYSKIHVHGTSMGGSFGSKEGLMIEAIAVLLAQKTGRHVQIRYDRKESMVSTFTRHATKFYGKMGINEQGKITALDLKAIINTGPYCGDTTNVQGSMCSKMFKLYQIPNMRFVGQPAYTNTQLGGAMRGYGSPALFYALELLVNKAAKELNMDPVEFRMNNLVEPYGIDPTDQRSLGNARIKDCLQKGNQLFNWKEKRTRQKSLNTERYAYGYGVATTIHGNGVAPAPDITVVSLALNEDGSMLLRTGISDHGAGTYTVLKQIAADILDMPMEALALTHTDTFSGLYDRGAGSSRNTWVGGAAVAEVAQRMKNTMIRIASEVFGVSAEEIILEDEVFKTKDNKAKIDKKGIACYAYQVKRVKLIETLSYDSPRNAGSYGAHFAGVQVDKFTGEIKVEDYVAVCDVGTALNPLLLEGQIEGAILMGLGMALFEGLQLDEKGVPKNASFKKYHMPKARDMPKITIHFVEAYEEGGPFGAKSIGEAAIVPVAPAIVNAVNDALETELTELPLLPDKILKAIYK